MDRQKVENFVRKNWIGLLILAVGFISFAVVGIKAVTKFTAPQEGEVVVSQQEIREFRASERPRSTSAPLRAAPEPKFKRDKDIKEGEITGAWQANIKNAKLLMQMRRGQYKLVIIPGNNGNRFYSNGTYTLDGDILLLKPDFNISAPQSNVTSYAVLTRSPFPVMVTKNKGNLVFQRPVPAANVYVPNIHPLLSRAEYDLVVFDVLK